MPRQGRPRIISRKASGTKLYIDDLREAVQLVKVEGESLSDVIRSLVHEALRNRRLRAIGRDEGDDFVRRVHRETIAEAVGPLREELAGLRALIAGKSAQQAASSAEGLKPENADYGLTEALAQMAERLARLDQRLADERLVPAMAGAVSAAKINRALVALVSHLLRREAVAESLVRLLVSVGMEKDQLGPEEIRLELDGQEKEALGAAHRTIRMILQEHGLVRPSQEES
jgi:predicted CopG family antitoxin